MQFFRNEIYYEHIVSQVDALNQKVMLIQLLEVFCSVYVYNWYIHAPNKITNGESPIICLKSYFDESFSKRNIMNVHVNNVFISNGCI